MVGRKYAGKEFIVRNEQDGRILLTPVVVKPDRELWLHENPAAKRLLAQGLKDAAAGRTDDGGDFAEYLGGDAYLSEYQP
jgi:hypothetical protein